MSIFRSRRAVVLGAVLGGILGGCGLFRSGPPDLKAIFPQSDLVSVQVVDQALLGKKFMPGGAIARYRHGEVSYEMFAGYLPSATDAAILMAHWDGLLKNARLVHSLDAYYGEDAGRRTYVFAKGRWIAGVIGLLEPESDERARALAAQLR